MEMLSILHLFYVFDVHVPRDGVPLEAIYIGGTNSFYVSFYVSSGMSNVISSLLTTFETRWDK